MTVKLRPAASARYPFTQLGPSPPRSASLDGNGQRLPLSDQDDQSFASRHAGVDQVSLQHCVMLYRQRNNYGGIFGALAFVDCRCIGEHQFVEFAKAVDHLAPLEVDGDLAFLHIDARHDAQIAVIDLTVVVVHDLHYLVAGAEGPAEALDTDLTRRVQQLLQFNVERAGAESTAVHRAEHLDIAYRVEPKALGDAIVHDRQ